MALNHAATYVVDGVAHRYYGTHWGRIHLLSCSTGLRLRLPNPGGPSIEPDEYEFALLCAEGRVTVQPKAPTHTPRHSPGGGRPWQATRRNPSMGKPDEGVA